MSGNGGGKCFGVTVTVYGTAVMNPRSRTKGAYMHVSTLTLKSVMELRKRV